MKPYLSDHVSGVVAYVFVKNSIVLKFRSKSEYYLYTPEKTGADHLKTMKQLAEEGSGLSTYVNKFVRANYKAASFNLKELIDMAV